MKTIKDNMITIIGCIFIIGGMLLAEKHSTNASWVNIIKSEFWEIILIIIVTVVLDVIIRIIKDN